MVIKMKKTISLLLAILVAAVAICTLTVCAFADPADGEAQTPSEGESVSINDPRVTDPTTQEATEATEATEASSQQATEATQATQAGNDDDPTDSSTTSVDDGDDATTKQPAKVDDDIPATGSGIVVPAVALLALAGGVAVAVKSKKD